MQRKKETGGDALSADIVVVRAAERHAAAIAAFNAAMARETEGKQLDVERVFQGVRGMLEGRADGFYLVAECRGEPVGALMVTFEWSDWRDGWFWWLQSVYVLPEYRRRGVFRILFEKLRTEAEKAGDVCGLRLYVEKNNGVAQATYRALGMVETPYDMYELEF